MLGSLARALRLSDSDRDLIFRLAGSEPPGIGRIPMTVRPSVMRLLDRLAGLPALVLSAKSDVLAWNPPAAALFGDWSAQPPERRNLIRQRFLGGGPDRVVETGDQAGAADCVGCLRTAQARYPRDPSLAALVDELRSGSTQFDELWRSGRSGRLRSRTASVAHPELGVLTLDCDVLSVPEADQTVIVYSSATGTATASALELLRRTGRV